MTCEEQRLALDREKFEFERGDARHERELRERDFREQRKARMWSQVATFVPIIAIILGFWVNLSLEAHKQANANVALARKMKREFVDRQLAEFYYPIKLRLEKDSAVWTLSGGLAGRVEAGERIEFSAFIEHQILIPNHDEIVRIMDTKFALLKNSDEAFTPEERKAMMAAITHYERHVATYKALRATKIPLNPIGVCRDDCSFPLEFPKFIDARIDALERQRSELMQQLVAR